MKLYILTSDFLDFRSGDLILQGPTEEEGTEYFNMTMEIEDKYGLAISLYNIPHHLLSPANEGQIKTVQDYFDKVNADRENGIAR